MSGKVLEEVVEKVTLASSILAATLDKAGKVATSRWPQLDR